MSGGLCPAHRVCKYRKPSGEFPVFMRVFCTRPAPGDSLYKVLGFPNSMDINIFGLLLAFVRSMKKKIAVFASGSGSNAQKIMEYFRHHPTIEVAIVLTNNPDAYVLQRADNFEIPTHVFDRRAFYE